MSIVFGAPVQNDADGSFLVDVIVFGLGAPKYIYNVRVKSTYSVRTFLAAVSFAGSGVRISEITDYALNRPSYVSRDNYVTVPLTIDCPKLPRNESVYERGYDAVDKVTLADLGIHGWSDFSKIVPETSLDHSSKAGSYTPVVADKVVVYCK